MKETGKVTDEQKLADLLYALYKGLPRAYGKYTITQQGIDGKKTQGRASTEIGVYESKLWVGHLYGTAGLGVIPITDEATCSWGAIDIDKYDLDLLELERKIHELNLPLLVIRTKSGGAHLTCYFKDPIPCKKVRSKLYEFSISLGYGGVEIFPKQSSLASKNDVGNWLNMPYFEHLNTTRYALFRGKPLSVMQFLELAEKIKVDEETLVGINVAMKGNFDDGPPCLQLITKNGKIPEGTRNSTLFALGVYSRKKYEDDWTDKVEELNQDFISPPLKSREVQTIVRSLSRKDYFYPCGKSPLQEHCNKDLCKKRPFGIGELEEEFELNLGSLCKIGTEPPIWIIDVEGVRVQLDTEDLIDQMRFRRVCMMAINKLPPLMKRVPWEKLVREKLENVEIIEAPAETRVAPRVNQYVRQFLINTPAGESREELSIGRPWHDYSTGMVYFRGNDLIRFLDNNNIRLEPRKVWNSLRENGTGHRQIKLGNTTAQVWFVPLSSVEGVSVPQPDTAQEAF